MVEASGGVWKDRFAAYQVHLYKLSTVRAE
jgi:hypothetical protein